MKIAVSACLLGKNVRYDGSNKLNKQLLDILKDHEVIEICPEIFSGFVIPHEPLEILNDEVYTKSNDNVTSKLINGSNLTFEKCKDADLFILKSKSPSCGYQKIYDGTFTGKLIDGNGIFTSLVLKQNKKVFSEEDLDKIIIYLEENDCNH